MMYVVHAYDSCRQRETASNANASKSTMNLNIFIFALAAAGCMEEAYSPRQQIHFLSLFQTNLFLPYFFRLQCSVLIDGLNVDWRLWKCFIASRRQRRRRQLTICALHSTKLCVCRPLESSRHMRYIRWLRWHWCRVTAGKWLGAKTGH